MAFKLDFVCIFLLSNLIIKSEVLAQCQNFYTIFNGDTCANIANAFRTTTTTIQQLNPTLNCASLITGQQICVPYVNNNFITLPPATTCSNFYTIFSGDTCDNIAGAFRTTTFNLQTLNPGLNCQSLSVGQRICVPTVNNNISPQVVCANFYTIFSGDTCDNIAGAFRTTTSNLLTLNPGLNCASLPVGQRICVPTVNNNIVTTASPITNCPNFYTIFSGDTCTNIAGAFRTTIAGLQALNPGLNCNSLPIGQRICVPAVNNNIVTTASPITNCQNFYTIFSGDTCTNIAGAFRTTIAGLQALNPGLNCNSLPIGQRICVPAVNNNIVTTSSPVTCSTNNFYVISSTDTCNTISSIFSITTFNLQLLNPGLNCLALPVGQRICVPSLSFTTTSSPISCQNFYTIFSGDTCTNIAGAFRTTIAGLQALNPGLNCNSLPIGQRICVPAVNNNIVTTASPITNCQNFYTIFSGDTCTNIAGAFRTTIAGLQALNPGLNCVSLPIGQRICVPSVNNNIQTTCTTGNLYTILSSDSCTSIAAKFSTTSATLIQLNPSLNCVSLPLTAGQQICVPNINNVITNCQGVFYTIFSGDTCANIAGAFRTTVTVLQQLNPTLNCAAPQAGLRVCVPTFGFTKNSILVPSVFIPSQSSCSNFYTISQEDTCDIIASILKTNVNSLLMANPSLNCAKLIKGSSICVPALTILTSNTNNNIGSCLNYYNVQFNDICFNIAIKAQLTIEQFFELNPNINCNSLQIGQQVCVSNVARSINRLCSFNYTVQKADTCFSLALKFGINLNKFTSSLNCNKLQIGQEICI